MSIGAMTFNTYDYVLKVLNGSCVQGWEHSRNPDLGSGVRECFPQEGDGEEEDKKVKAG